MKKFSIKSCFWIVLIFLIFVNNIAAPAAARKNVKNCNFTVNRAAVNKKARKVKMGSTKLTVKSGFIRFVAPSRAKYTFTWSGLRSGKRVKITPLFVLNNKTLSCLGYYCNYDIYGNSRNIFICEGYMDCTKYKDLNYYGEKKANKYRIILDKGEELYFFMKIAPKKKADIGLKITRKSAHEAQRPVQEKTITIFENLKQSIIESDSHNNEDSVREKSWSNTYGVIFTERIIYKKQTGQIVFEWDYMHSSESYKIYMIYDKSTITTGKTDIHIIKYFGECGAYDAVANVNIYTMADETDIRFTVNKNPQNASINDINFDALSNFDSCIDPANWMRPFINYNGVLSDLGISYKDLGFVSYF